MCKQGVGLVFNWNEAHTPHRPQLGVILLPVSCFCFGIVIVISVPISDVYSAAKHAKLLDSLKHLKVATDASADSDEEEDEGSVAALLWRPVFHARNVVNAVQKAYC